MAVALAAAVLAACGGPGAVDRDAGRAPPWPQRPVVTAALDLAPDLSTATGGESVLFTPDRPICEMVFRNWVNRPSAVADGTSSTITSAAVDGRPVTPRVEQAGAPRGAPGTLVTLPLPRCVGAGTPVRADLAFRIVLGAESTERIGHSPRRGTAWLGTPLPLLAWVRGQGWVRDPAVGLPGETVVSEDARLDALRVTANADQAVSGTGSPAGTSTPTPGRTTHLFTADAVRDVAVAAGAYQVTETRVGDVRVHVAVPRSGARSSGSDWAGEIGRRMGGLQALLGPYPYPDLWATVVPEQSDGVEFPTHLQFGDVGARRRPALVAHETAHQWFYSLVGNDQGRDPWLDEAFATFVQAVVAGQQEDFRGLDPRDADGPVGAPMAYWARRGDFDTYVHSVYDQGAAALLAGRDRVGPDRFDPALRAYVGANAHRVATPADVATAFRDLPPVLDALRAHGAFDRGTGG